MFNLSTLLARCDEEFHIHMENMETEINSNRESFTQTM